MKLGFIVGEVLSALRRNVSMVVSVVLVTFVSLVFVGSAALLQMQVNGMKDYWYDRVQVAVFLCPEGSPVQTCAGGEATEEQKAAIEEALQGDDLAPYVEEVIFEDKATAFRLYNEQFEGTSLEGAVAEDQMQESFRVRLVDAEQYEILDEYFSATEGVEDVVDQHELLDQIFAVLNVLTMVAIAVAVLMLVCAVLLISTTIRLSAFSRRRETGIMRLVGASNAFIQMPFVLEGVIASGVGAVLASVALGAVVYFGVDGWLQDRAPSFDLVGLGDVALVAPALVVLGIVLAGVASLVTLRRYMKV
ncbi:permease-like cell division protein FtsX [Brevibacterium samyangense]|uniref:Cell division protein FtsX n=1 Tax=Brevibacterium samyangense TaxID=366888 RepID=A0ABP5EPV4_9MICO